MTIVGGNTVWLVNPLTEVVRRRVLPMSIFLQAVSDTGVASGGEDLPDGSRVPMFYDIITGTLVMPALPAGAPSGFAGGISKTTGLASGSVSNGVQHAMLWTTGGAIVADPNTLPGVSLPPGTVITNTPGVTDTGLLAGFATTPSGQQEGVVVAPSPQTKLPLLLKAFDVYVDKWGAGGAGELVREFKGLVREAVAAWKQNHRKRTCAALKDAAEGLKDIAGVNYQETFDPVYESGIARTTADEIARPALGIELRAALAEFAKELGCPGVKEQLGL